jgi:acyl carrier protein
MAGLASTAANMAGQDFSRNVILSIDAKAAGSRPMLPPRSCCRSGSSVGAQPCDSPLAPKQQDGARALRRARLRPTGVRPILNRSGAQFPRAFAATAFLPATEIIAVDQSKILGEVADIIRDVLDVHDAKGLRIDAETTADQTEGWDSFNHINIVVATEQHFGVKFKTAEIESLRNVGELVALIARKKGL